MNQTLSTPTAVAADASSTLWGALTFIRPQSAKPFIHSSAYTGDKPKFHFDAEIRRVPIHDMRALDEAPSVEREGFELVRHKTRVADLYDDAAVAGDYFAETEALLKRRFGASRVAIFDVTRRSDAGGGAANPEGLRGPARRVHVDYTAKSGPQRVRDILGEAEAARLEKAGARIIQINTWRPIRGPVRRTPLALADAGSVAPDELIATDQIFPDRVGEIYHLAHAPEQRWYYAPLMGVDEVMLIKSWDSLDDGRARFTPHSAFDLDGSDETTPARESIELRTLVVIE